MGLGGELLHTPVLLSETLSYLSIIPNGTYVDGTLGLGGHSEAILESSAPNGKLIAFDWDSAAIAEAKKRLERFGDRLTIIRKNFSELDEGLAEAKIGKIDGLLIDIGVSSLQLDQGGRGFSFKRDEPLDMRMDNRGDVNAAKLISESSEQELADILYYYGEEKQARRIAAVIVKTRKKENITTSGQLAELVGRAIPRRFHPRKIHVATKTFQGLRIAVNKELVNLASIIDMAPQFLKPGARFCVITFHSLEDRIVKRKFKENKLLRVITAQPVIASKTEVEKNPRSRSAKLRVACRVGEHQEVMA